MMSGQNEEVGDVLEIFEALKKKGSLSLYTESLEPLPKGYERWYKELEKEFSGDSFYGFASWVLLPVHLERGYEILFEKGYITKDNLKNHRIDIVSRYIKEFQNRDWEDAPVNVQGDSFDEIVAKSRLYIKILDFYFKDQESSSSDVSFVLESLKHIVAMAAKNMLDIGGLDDYGKRLDKKLMLNIIETYTAIEKNQSRSKRNNALKVASSAHRQIQKLFDDF